MATPPERNGPRPPDTPSLADLVDEVATRARAGEAVDWEAYLRDHPRHADRLRELLPAVGLLAGVARSEHAQDGAPAVRPPSLQERAVVGDYRILREVGRGGMGVVYEAEQVSLHRRVALKVLSLSATLDPRQVQRFYTEAQAAAQLQHDHIVPVYAVGCSEGLHYYAMQFIEGLTLASVIERRRHLQATGPAEGPLPTDGAPESSALTTPSSRGATFFRAAASLGIQAAHALDYAHQVGIVHRDIKPANLLLDDSGRLWVTDFGLARVQAEPGLTQTGDLVGTLRYMSPEQALGRRGVDYRTDIYALGLTLYELLTLRPALPGDDRQELLRRIASEEPAPPRRLDRDIPLDLETIVLKAVAKDAAARYPSALEMAEDLQRFLDGRPVLARRPTPLQRAAKWVRRHSGLVAAAMLVLLLLTIGTGVSAALVLRERDQLRGEQGRTKAALEGEARRGRLARRALERMSSQVINEWLVRQPQLNAEQRAFLEAALADYEELTRETGSDPESRTALALVLVRIGEIRSLFGQDAEAEAAYRRGQGLLQQELAQGPEDPVVCRHLAGSFGSLALTLDRTGRLQGAIEATEEGVRVAADLVRRFPGEEDFAVLLATLRSNLSLFERRRSRPAEAERSARLALELCRERTKRSPRNTPLRRLLATALREVGACLTERGELARAEPAFREALAVLHRLTREHPADLLDRAQAVQVRALLGQLYLEDGRHADAVQSLSEALKEQARLSEQLPGHAAARESQGRIAVQLGTALAAAGKGSEAEAAHRQGVSLLRALVKDKPESPAYRAHLSNALDHLGAGIASSRPAEAEAAYREAITLRRALSRQAPADSSHRTALATMLSKLGHLLVGSPRAAEGEAHLREALELAEALVAEGPANARFRSELGKGHYNLGLALVSANKRPEAEVAYRRAIVELTEAARLAPAMASYRAALADGHNNLGTVLRAGRRYAEAALAYRATLALRRDLPRDAPHTQHYRGGLADGYANLSQALYAAGRLGEAEGAGLASVSLREQVAADGPDDAENRARLGAELYNLALLLRRRQENACALALLDRSAAHQRHAVWLAPRHPGYRQQGRRAHDLLAELLLREGDHARAAAVAMALPGTSPGGLPDYWIASTVLARCCRLAEQDGALSGLGRHAIVWAYTAAARGVALAGLERSGDRLPERDLLARALANYPAAELRNPHLAEELSLETTRRLPHLARTWNTLALARYRAGDWQGARAALDRSLRLGRGDGHTFGLLSLVCCREQNREQARVWHDRATRWTARHAPKDLELHALCAEAQGRARRSRASRERPVDEKKWKRSVTLSAAREN